MQIIHLWTDLIFFIVSDYLVSKEFRKDRSVHRYLILEILTNPASVTEKFTAIFAGHLLLLPEKISWKVNQP